MSIDTVAVTGGNGRIGRATIETLNEHGYRTINLDRSEKFGTEASRQEAEQVADEYLTVDLLDAGDVFGALASSDSDAVIHMGTIRGATNHPGHTIYESNVMTSYNIMEAATELELDSLCLASSLNVIGSVYQTSQGIFAVDAPVEVEYLPMDESHPHTPRDPYALGKHALEETADGFARLETPPRTISSLRFPWVLFDDELREMLSETDRSVEGIRDPPDWLAPANPALSRDVIFSYLHVEDAAEAARCAVTADFEGHEPFWVVADDTTAEASSTDLAEEFYPDAGRQREFDGTESLIDNSKAASLLDWEPKRSWRNL